VNNSKNNLPTILIGFFSNPEHIMPLFDTINSLSSHYNIIVIQLDTLPLNYKYSEGIKLIKINRNRPLPFTFIEFIYRIFECLIKNKINLLMCFDMTAFVGASIAKISFKKIPTMYHQYETVLTPEIPRYKILYFIKSLEKFFVKNISMLSFVEPYRAKTFLEDSNLKFDYVVFDNYPKTLRTIPPLNRQIKEIKENGHRIVLHRGPISNGDDIDIYETIQSMKFWALDAALIIQGPLSEKDKSACRKIIIQEQVEDRVIFIPFIMDYNDLFSIIACADIGLVLYKPKTINRIHGTPVKLYDYFACGVPVIVPQSMKYISEIVTNNNLGFTYLSSNIEDLGKTIKKLLEHPNRKIMGQNARKLHLERFNHEHQFSQILSSIKNIIKHN